MNETEDEMAGFTLSWIAFANGTAAAPTSSRGPSTSSRLSSPPSTSPSSPLTTPGAVILPPVSSTSTPTMSTPSSPYSPAPTPSSESSLDLPVAVTSSSPAASSEVEESVLHSQPKPTVIPASPFPTSSIPSTSEVATTALSEIIIGPSPTDALDSGGVIGITSPSSTTPLTQIIPFASQSRDDSYSSRTASSSVTHPLPLDTPSQTPSITILNPSNPPTNPTSPAKPPLPTKKQPPLLVILAIVISAVIFLLLATIVLRKLASQKRRQRQREFFQLETAQDTSLYPPPLRAGRSSTRSIATTYHGVSRGGVVSLATGELTTEEVGWETTRGDGARYEMSGGARGYHEVERFGIGTAF
ncbi:hypothetical protein F5Y08DRAFT_314886 [Xylaria arbuscula]|nr:hypothetical protein F5Y08DRAFT_314886 [Xylaria arbuscula]